MNTEERKRNVDVKSNNILAKHRDLAGNRKVEHIDLNGCGLTIEFENGHQLHITSDGQGDGYCTSVIIYDPETNEEHETVSIPLLFP